MTEQGPMPGSTPPSPPMPPAPPAWSPAWSPASGHWPGTLHVLSLGHGLLISNYRLIMGSTALFVLAHVVAMFIPFAGGIAVIFLTPFSAAITLCAVRTSRGEVVEELDFVHAPGSRYWWMLLMGLLIGIAQSAAKVPMLLLTIPIAVLGGTQDMLPTVLACGIPLALICSIAGWYVHGRLMFAPMLFLDAPPGQLDLGGAFRLSWERTAHCAWGLVWLQLITTLVLVASLLALCVGVVLYGAPFWFSTLAIAYRCIFPEQHSGICARCGYDVDAAPGAPCPECGDAHRM